MLAISMFRMITPPTGLSTGSVNTNPAKATPSPTPAKIAPPSPKDTVQISSQGMALAKASVNGLPVPGIDNSSKISNTSYSKSSVPKAANPTHSSGAIDGIGAVGLSPPASALDKAEISATLGIQKEKLPNPQEDENSLDPTQQSASSDSFLSSSISSSAPLAPLGQGQQSSNIGQFSNQNPALVNSSQNYTSSKAQRAYGVQISQNALAKGSSPVDLTA